MSPKDSESPGGRRPLPREPDQATDPGRSQPYETLYRDPDGAVPDTHRTTARHYEPSLSPPEEQPPGDTYHWLYRAEPEPAEPAPTDAGLADSAPPESDRPPTEAGSLPLVEHADGATPVPPPQLPESPRPNGGHASHLDVAARRRRRVWPVLVLALLLVAAGVLIAVTSGAVDLPRQRSGSPATSGAPTEEGARFTTGPTSGPSSGAPSTPAATPSGTASPTRSSAPEPYDGAVAPVATSRVRVDCQAPASTDGEGQRVGYAARQLVDGDVSTAWRCQGDGAGRTIVFSFPPGTRIAELGLINGYAKTDPKTRADRYDEYRRILAVNWTFANGSTFSQGLEDGLRSAQKLRIPVQAAEQVRLTIVSSSEPGGRAKSRDAVLISETTFGAPQD